MERGKKCLGGPIYLGLRPRYPGFSRPLVSVFRMFIPIFHRSDIVDNPGECCDHFHVYSPLSKCISFLEHHMWVSVEKAAFTLTVESLGRSWCCLHSAPPHLVTIATMGRIIHCADLVLKVDDETVIGNISQWILESTEFRPTNMETCTIRDEMSTYQKLWLIMVVWLTLVLLSFLYCYFCEQRLFQGSQRLFDRTQADASLTLPPTIWKILLTALSLFRAGCGREGPVGEWEVPKRGVQPAIQEVISSSRAVYFYHHAVTAGVCSISTWRPCLHLLWRLYPCLDSRQ